MALLYNASCLRALHFNIRAAIFYQTCICQTGRRLFLFMRSAFSDSAVRLGTLTRYTAQFYVMHILGGLCKTRHYMRATVQQRYKLPSPPARRVACHVNATGITRRGRQQSYISACRAELELPFCHARLLQQVTRAKFKTSTTFLHFLQHRLLQQHIIYSYIIIYIAQNANIHKYVS